MEEYSPKMFFFEFFELQTLLEVIENVFAISVLEFVSKRPVSRTTGLSND